MGRFSSLANAPDADLASRAAAGDNNAFEELYRRHADAAWRVAQAVTRHHEDAADAVSDAFTRVLKALPEGRLREGDSFRAYLLMATRRAGIDTLRRRNRQAPGDMATLADRPTTAGSPTDKLLQATDNALVTAAFRTLPERWRSVLWLTEVERIPAKDAAPLLGMSPNGVAQLAVRARNGLRERYIQAHLRSGEVEPTCRFTVEHLGAYVAGALSPRDLAKVDQHLAGCEPCRARHAELEEVGDRLRRVVVPLPIGLGALALKNWRFNAGHSLAGKAAKSLGWAAKAERPLAVMSAALFAAGIAGLGTVGDDAGPRPAPRDGTESAAAPLPKVSFEPAGSARSRLSDNGVSSTSENLSDERRLSRRPAPDRFTDDRPDAAEPPPSTAKPPIIPSPPPAPGPGPGPSPDPPPTPPVAQLLLTVSGGGTAVSAGATQGQTTCVGAKAGTQTLGCPPPPSSSTSAVTVSTGGSAVPVHEEIGLP